MAIVQRLRALLRRQRVASDLGLKFRRQSTFHLGEVTYLRDGTCLYLPGAQPHISLDVINVVFDDEYGLRKLRTAPRMIVDIGANVGIFSWYARRLYPNSKILGFEPNPSACKYAIRNVPDAEIRNAAVGSADGFISLSVTDDWRLSTSAKSNDGDVKMLAFGEIMSSLSEDVDLLKMDCEGAEWDILQDADAFHRVKRIHMEYHLVQNRTLHDLEVAATRLGFRTKKLVRNNGFGIVWLARN